MPRDQVDVCIDLLVGFRSSFWVALRILEAKSVNCVITQGFLLVFSMKGLGCLWAGELRARGRFFFFFPPSPSGAFLALCGSGAFRALLDLGLLAGLAVSCVA